MSKGRVPQRHKVTKKLKWVPMEINRVPLNPEQAVLSCCSQQDDRGPFISPFQCSDTILCDQARANQWPSS